MHHPICTNVIEPLESRIAPASLVNPQTVNFRDVDGDVVTITVSHGDLTNHVIFEGGFGTAGTPAQQLLQINLNTPQFAHANVTISVQLNNGDGLVHFGFLNAVGVALGDVTVKGDVGKILASGLTSLSMGSLGKYTTNVGAPDFQSSIAGAVGDVHFTGDVNNAAFAVKGAIGNVTVDGGIIGGSTVGSGSITSTDVIGNISIVTGITGGSKPSTGLISAVGGIGSVTLGTLQGGSGTGSGRIYSGANLGAVSVSGLHGGSGDGSGSIEVKGNLSGFTDFNDVAGGSGKLSGSLLVHGSVTGNISINTSLSGGANIRSGSVEVDGNANDITMDNLTGGAGMLSGSVVVKGDAGQIHALGIMGNSGISSGSISSGGTIDGVDVTQSVTGGSKTLSGSIRAVGIIGSVTIGGNLTGGTAANAGSVGSLAGLPSVTVTGNVTTSFGVGSGAISTNGDLGTVIIHGAVTGTASHPVIISAKGTNVTAPGGASSGTIDSLTVDGSASFLNVLGGYDVNRVAANADAQIGTIKIGTTVKGSNFVAGALPGAISGVKGFGVAGTKAIAGGSASIFSTIANVIIGGQTANSGDAGAAFAIVAQQIDGVSVNGTAKTLVTGPNNDHGIAVGAATDFIIQEIV